MNPQQERAAYLTRRQFFSKSATGLGAAALASLLNKDAFSAFANLKRTGGLPDVPHFAPKAKRVIYMLQNGAPPHVDMFDYKPGLKDLFGTEIPESIHKNQRQSTMTATAKKLVLPPFTGFKQYGK